MHMLLIQTGFVSFQKEKLLSSKNHLMCLIIFHFAKTAIQDLIQGMLEEVGKRGGSTFSGFGVLFIHSDWFLRYSSSRINKEI